jgi:hypothetical protein
MERARRILVVTLMVGGISAIPAAAAQADVVLNEINCEGTDWVELVNTSNDPADVSGWLLTDEDLDLPEGDEHLMEFDAETVIPGNGDLVVERETNFEFGISCSDTLMLGDAEAELVDQTTIGPRNNSSDAWGRYPNGTGPFVPTVATRGEPNLPSTDDEEPPPDLAAWLYDPGAVVEIDLDLPPSSLDALEEEPTEYVEGQFSLTTTGASYGPLEVGVRLKGGLGSFRPLGAKAAFKVKFNEFIPGQRFVGLKTLTLNNMVQDSSNMHEALTYEAFRAAGVAAPRTGYAYVRLNDEDYGLYLNVETMDEISLAHWYESTGHLYEGAYGNEVVPGGASAYEVDEGSESNRSDLEALIEAVNSTEADWSEGLAEEADLEQMTRMWAMEVYVGHWDGYASGYLAGSHPNNYYLHSTGDGRFTMLPWGTDQTLMERLPFDRPFALMARLCSEDESCAAQFRAGVIHARDTVAGLDLDARATAIAGMLAPWQAIDPKREYSLDGIADGVSAARAFLANRPYDVDVWLSGSGAGDGAPPAGSGPPQTTITGHPKGRTRARRVGFKFLSSVSGSSFECKLDRGQYAGCSSPHRIKVGPGRHRFLVRATAAGLPDASAAEFRFEVLDAAKPGR